MTNSTNYVSQVPGQLNLEMVDDNDLVFAIDWHMDITDYQFDANIVPKNCETEIPMTVTVVDEVAGTMNVAVTAASLADIQPATHNWYMNWTTPAPDNYIRTVLAGVLVLRSR